MDDLRKELVPIAVQRFKDFMTEGEAFSLYGEKYIAFAEKEKNLFRFLFLRKEAFPEIKELLNPEIEKNIKTLMETYGISHEEADKLHDHLWMHAHGIASMIATDFCHWDRKKAVSMIEESKEVFLSAYEKQHR